MTFEQFLVFVDSQLQIEERNGEILLTLPHEKGVESNVFGLKTAKDKAVRKEQISS